MATYRIKKLTTGSYALTGIYYDDTGTHTNVTTPVTCLVYDGAGSLVYTATTTNQSGHVQASIPYASLPKLDTYSVVYTGVTQPGGQSVSWTDTIELVGGYLFEISDLRTMDRAFLDLTKYPTETLQQVRIWVEDVIEGPRAAQVAFVPRGRRTTLNGTAPDLNRGYHPLLYGNDYRDLICPDFEIRSLYSASINGTALTQTEIDDVEIDDNILHRSANNDFPAWPWGKRNISLHYSHGYDRPPGAIIRAGLILAREYLIKSDLPGRATATSIGDQLFRLTIAGRDGITGIPDVDAAIDQFGRKGYGIG